MAELIRDWAGKDRTFRLLFGDVLDLEQACDAAIGTIYARVVAGQFRAGDLWHTIRLALIAGGMEAVRAKALLVDQFDRKPYVDHAALAAEILIAIMTGVEPPASDAEPPPPAPMKFSDVSQICRVFHLSPVDLRAMRYADVINLMRGYSAAGRKAEPPSEAEFEAMLLRHFTREEAAK